MRAMDTPAAVAPTEAPLTIAARDGHALSALLIAPASPTGALLFASGTGFPKEFYAPLARHLAQRGHAVLLFDYRGIGGSAPASLRGFDASMSDWALRDMAGALDALATRYPDLPLRWLGHSFGGQVVGVVPGIERCVRIATIAASIGRWQWQAAPRKYAAALWWHAVGPLDLARKGYATRNAIWQGKPLPAGVFRQWKRWCASPRYFAIDVGGALGAGHFERLREPIRALCFTDDWIATPRNVAALHALYERPGVRATWLSPRELGLPRIDHEGAFLRGNAAVWPHVAALLD
jgi:predicted alpha/beta hydrolase